MQKEIKKIIDKYDPLGLLDLGAPKDEYEAEALMIAAALRPDMSLLDVETVVFDVFEIQFGGIKQDDKVLKNIAKEVFDNSSI